MDISRKSKNPMNDALERNLDQASYYIDLMDMLQVKMKGNLSEWEEQYIIHSLSELKLNFIDEQKKGSDSSSEESDKSEDQKTEKSKTEAKTKAKKKAKKATKKKKD
jgi:preprotein translocase subunit SecF